MDPHELHPDLSWDRLGYLAEVIVRVRHGAVLMHQPEKGDNLWSLGCRAYARTCFAFAEAAKEREPDWLRVLDSESHFVILVGRVPVRFYSGDPERPPSRALRRNNPELEAAQYALQFDAGSESKLGLVRLMVERDRDLEVKRISLVNLDQDGHALHSWTLPLIPPDSLPAKPPSHPTGPDVIPLSRRKEGVDLPPADPRPSRPEEEEHDEMK